MTSKTDTVVPLNVSGGFVTQRAEHVALVVLLLTYMMSFVDRTALGVLQDYIAPTFARLQSMVDTRMRATAASILFLIINLIGLGLGPPLVGYIGDRRGIAAGLTALSLFLVWAAAHLWRAGVCLHRRYS
jgi:MFS family permease